MIFHTNFIFAEVCSFFPVWKVTKKKALAGNVKGYKTDVSCSLECIDLLSSVFFLPVLTFLGSPCMFRVLCGAAGGLESFTTSEITATETRAEPDRHSSS